MRPILPTLRQYPDRALPGMRPSNHESVEVWRLAIDDDECAKWARPLDGHHDGIHSPSCKVWISTHLGRDIAGSLGLTGEQQLWRSGYVIFDLDTPRITLWKIANEVRVHFVASDYPTEKTLEIMYRSEDQRSDIYEALGAGYWPVEEIDFSRIHGLSRESQEKLTLKFLEEKDWTYEMFRQRRDNAERGVGPKIYKYFTKDRGDKDVYPCMFTWNPDSWS
jgi:hypothetical protein